ncbi:MAG TPA: hypothetical protein VJ602_09325 [Paludibacter sp.]|nr:hypothetical protein [Paludibacter sp.]
MKTSNIIITAFAILITGAVFFLFADSKRHVEEEKNKISYKEFPLSAFKVIVAEYHSDIHVDRSDSTSMKIEYVKGVKAPAKLYEVINDTLHVYGGLRAFVKCKQISQIIGKNHWWINVSNFEPDSLTIKVTRGRFLYNNDNGKKYTINQKIYNMNITANDSAIVDINNSRLGNLTIKSNNAFVNNYCDTKCLNAGLTHKARLYSKDTNGVITIEKDTTCNVSIDNNTHYAY